jgi:hypothetical protein
MAVNGLGGLLRHQPGPGERSPSLSPRRDRPADPTAGSSVLDVIKQIESDVGGYVARNELRERVRLFVTEALARICARLDVDAIVVNAHSDGTVVALDAVKRLDSALFAGRESLITFTFTASIPNTPASAPPSWLFGCPNPGAEPVSRVKPPAASF